MVGILATVTLPVSGTQEHRCGREMKSQDGREPRRFRRGSETRLRPELGYSLLRVPVQAVGLNATTKIPLAPSPVVKYALDIPFYRTVAD